MRRFRFVALVPLLAVLAGCATVFAPESQDVPVRSQPDGAEVYVDGVLRGRTPVTLTLEPRGSYEIMLRRGEQERTLTLESELQETYVVLDLLPGLGLAGASVALASTCDDPMVCLVAAKAASVGVVVGLGASAAATTTDAISGAWFELRPGSIDVDLE